MPTALDALMGQAQYRVNCIWQQPVWSDFRYDNRALNDRELEFRLNSERLAGSFDALPLVSQEDATIDLMLSEAFKTSSIEGESLDRESVSQICAFYADPARPRIFIFYPNTFGVFDGTFFVANSGSYLDV